MLPIPKGLDTECVPEDNVRVVRHHSDNSDYEMVVMDLVKIASDKFNNVFVDFND